MHYWLFYIICTVVYISLECDSIEVSEGDGQLEVCAVLTQGELERNVAVDFNTSCASACSKLHNV